MHSDPRVGNSGNDHERNQRAQNISKDDFTENTRTHRRKRRLEDKSKEEEKSHITNGRYHKIYKIPPTEME